MNPADQGVVPAVILDGRCKDPLDHAHANATHDLRYAGWDRNYIDNVNTNGKLIKEFAVHLPPANAHADNAWQGEYRSFDKVFSSN